MLVAIVIVLLQGTSLIYLCDCLEINTLPDILAINLVLFNEHMNK